MTTIKNIAGKVLYISEKPTLKEALEEAVKQEINLHKANLQGAKLADANIPYAKLVGANLEGANLVGANLSYANFDKTILAGADLEGANLSGANFEFANLSHANLKNAKSRYTSLVGADLVRANLTGVELAGNAVQQAAFGLHDLAGATFKGHTIDSAITFGPIGSRNDNLLALQTVDGLFFQVGCFSGTKEELLASVESTHGDSKHGRNYKLAVEFLENYLKERE